MLERVDELFASGECPPALVVFVDAWTSYGGSQFLNSSSTGPYLDYLCDEVVPFVDEPLRDAAGPRAPRAERQVLGRLRRDGGADAAPRRVRRARLARGRRAVRVLLPAELPASSRASCATSSTARSSVFLEQLRAGDHLDMERFENFDLYGYAAAYSPDPRAARAGAAALRRRHRPPGRRRVGAVARQGPGADGAAARRRAALDAPHLPRRRQGRRVVPGPRRAGVRGRARQARRGAHDRAVRRQARRDRRTATRARSASSCWRYGDARGRARARRHRRHLPADVGADQARARAARARRRADRHLQPGRGARERAALGRRGGARGHASTARG